MIAWKQIFWRDLLSPFARRTVSRPVSAKTMSCPHTMRRPKVLRIIYWETGAACDYLGRDVQFADAAVPKLE